MSEHTFEVVHLCARKVAHLTEYAVLGFLALRVARGEPYFARQPRPLQLAAALLFAALYASSDEFHQSFVPGRQAAVMDVLIDTTGAAVGLGITVAVARARRAM